MTGYLRDRDATLFDGEDEVERFGYLRLLIREDNGFGIDINVDFVLSCNALV